MSRIKRMVKFNRLDISAYMRVHKIKKSDFASACEVNKQAVSNWFSQGEMPARAMIILCNTLGFTPEKIKEFFK